MGKIIITEEILKNARDYIPYAEKKRFLDDCAGRCFDRLEISADGGAGLVAMPPMYKKNPFLVRRYMTAAVVMLYLQLPCAPADRKKDAWMISLDKYDEIAASHIFNQLDRLKSKVSSQVYKDKIFDMIADYRELEKMMNDEIYALLQVMNEPITRMLASIQLTATPDSLRSAAEQLKNVRDELETQIEATGKAAGTDGGNG